MHHKFVTVSELASYLGVSKDFVYRRVKPDSRDLIPHLRLGRKLKFDLESDAMKSWIDERRVLYFDSSDWSISGKRLDLPDIHPEP